MSTSKKNFTICLNMIVNDESHVILNTLNNLLSMIDFDYWVICDTGSTDNTKEIIQTFFNEKNIKGELYVDEWVDFGHNRTLALEKAFNKSDYSLIFDADDELTGEFIFPENIFDYDSYYLNLRSGTSFFTRIQLINNRKKWKYIGVLHEYIECSETSTSSVLNGNYYVNSTRDGNRSKDPKKYSKDALILEKAYEDSLLKGDQLYMRYSFYCANSYRDANDIDNAIKWYKNTLTLNNWSQEKYISCLQLYYLYEKQKNIELAIYYLIESYKYDNTRIECIYHLIKHYCIVGQNEIAYSFYTLIQNYYENNYISDTFSHKLFICENDYSFYLPYYMIIVCERLKKYELGLKMYDIIFTKGNVSIGEWWIQNLIYNLQFFIKKNKSVVFVNKWRHYLTLINDKKYNVDTNLVNKYEIYNVSNFFETQSPCTNSINNDETPYIVVAILSKDKEQTLPFYLNCLYNQTYDKKYIHLYIRTNDNKDNTNSILTDFLEKHDKEYGSTYFDNSSVSETLKQYQHHEWNSLRFSILGKIRQDSIDYALKLNAHYFVADCDNFIIPTTIENLFKNKNIGVIAPMLKSGFDTECHIKTVCEQEFYSNYHYDVDTNGYYKNHPNYYTIFNHDMNGLFRVCCVHCTYFIAHKYLSSIIYNDNTHRFEYVIFSETLRKRNIPQYIDNTNKYGYLTFVETKEDFEMEHNYNKHKYSF